MIVVIAIAKNEAPYLLEWIAYHQTLGVDHFVIFDNDSSDDTPKILSALTSSGDVTAIPWPTRDEYPSFEGIKIGPQVPAYKYGLELARANGRWTWMGCLDLDEFVVLDRERRLSRFLKAYEHAGAVGLNWRMYGSSGFKVRQPGLMIQSLTMRAPDDFTVNRHVKTFARVDCIDQPGIHMPRLKQDWKTVDTGGDVIDPIDNGLHSKSVYHGGWINHYYTKTETEFELKRLRGRVSKHDSDAERIRSPGDFAASDRNDVRDEVIARFQAGTTKRLKRLNRIVRRADSSRLWRGLKWR